MILEFISKLEREMFCLLFSRPNGAYKYNVYLGPQLKSQHFWNPNHTYSQEISFFRSIKIKLILFASQFEFDSMHFTVHFEMIRFLSWLMC